MVYTPVPGGTALVAGSQHDLLAGLTDDDHTQYALLAGRAGGQSLNGGTASGEHLTLVSTAHATKGQVRIGSATGLVLDGVTGNVGIGVAPDSTNKLRFQGSGNLTTELHETTSATSSVTSRMTAASAKSMDLHQYGSTHAGNTAYGIPTASLFAFESIGNLTVALAMGSITEFKLAYGTAGTPTKYTFGPSLLTFGDAIDMAFNATTGTKIGTATTQKLAFYNATPIVQGAAVADAAGGAIIDAEARTALNALLARIRATGLIAT